MHWKPIEIDCGGLIYKLTVEKQEKRVRERDVGILCVIIYDDLALAAPDSKRSDD